MFRSNSMASKMLKFYSKLVGLQYLWNTISDDVFLLMEKTKTGQMQTEVCKFHHFEIILFYYGLPPDILISAGWRIIG